MAVAIVVIITEWLRHALRQSYFHKERHADLLFLG